VKLIAPKLRGGRDEAGEPMRHAMNAPPQADANLPFVQLKSTIAADERL
jgi:hypothetical protein